MIRKILLLVLFINFSCTYNIKNKPDIFERQISEKSRNLMVIGDNLDYWGNDTPKAAIFIIYSKENYLNSFGIKVQSFEEFDKSIFEIEKQISTSNIYNLEIFGIKEKPNISIYSPLICDFINNNLYSAEKIFSSYNLSFRIKEREWVETNLELDHGKYNMFFIRLGISLNYFDFIKNRNPEFIKIFAEERNLEMKNNNYITCTENIFLEQKYLVNIYLNPDIVFNFNKNK